MARKAPAEPRIELLQGTLDMMILRALGWGPQHGHGIGLWIRTTSDEVLKVEYGSLYPALHRSFGTRRSAMLSESVNSSPSWDTRQPLRP